MKQVFLSYARVDGKKAKQLYEDLCRLAPARIWYDRVDLLPGVKWKPAIRKAIRESDYFLAVLSNQSVASRGVRHSELREALEVMTEFPEDSIYLVPTRLDDCPMPFDELKELNYADLFPKWKDGVAQLCRIFGNQERGAPPYPLPLGPRWPQSTDSRLSKGSVDDLCKGSLDLNDLNKDSFKRIRRRTGVKHNFHYKVGLVNLNPSGTNFIIERIARGLNSAQSVFHLLSATLPAPQGALTTINSFPQLYISHLPSSFYEQIGPLDMDCVVCLTSRLLTFEENGSILYNYLSGPSPSDPRVLFVSHSNLDKYALEAGVPLEIALVYRITGQLVSYFLDLGYHHKTRNCPMDFTEKHSDLVGGIRTGQFCSYCSEELKTGISRPFANAFRAMLAWGR